MSNQDQANREGKKEMRVAERRGGYAVCEVVRPEIEFGKGRKRGNGKQSIRKELK